MVTIDVTENNSIAEHSTEDVGSPQAKRARVPWRAAPLSIEDLIDRRPGTIYSERGRTVLRRSNPVERALPWPMDVINDILSYCSFRDHMHLALTCTDMYTLLQATLSTPMQYRRTGFHRFSVRQSYRYAWADVYTKGLRALGHTDILEWLYASRPGLRQKLGRPGSRASSRLALFASMRWCYEDVALVTAALSLPETQCVTIKSLPGIAYYSTNSGTSVMQGATAMFMYAFLRCMRGRPKMSLALSGNWIASAIDVDNVAGYPEVSTEDLAECRDRVRSIVTSKNIVNADRSIEMAPGLYEWLTCVNHFSSRNTCIGVALLSSECRLIHLDLEFYTFASLTLETPCTDALALSKYFERPDCTLQRLRLSNVTFARLADWVRMCLGIAACSPLRDFDGRHVRSHRIAGVNVDPVRVLLNKPTGWGTLRCDNLSGTTLWPLDALTQEATMDLRVLDVKRARFGYPLLEQLIYMATETGALGSLQTLDWGYNSMDNRDVDVLSRWIGHPSCVLVELRLNTNVFSGLGMYSLSSALCSGKHTLRRLDVSDNYIGADGFVTLMAGVAGSRLRYLDVSRNNIDLGLLRVERLFADVAEKNTSFKRLVARHNRILLEDGGEMGDVYGVRSMVTV